MVTKDSLVRILSVGKACPTSCRVGGWRMNQQRRTQGPSHSRSALHGLMGALTSQELPLDRNQPDPEMTTDPLSAWRRNGEAEHAQRRGRASTVNDAAGSRGGHCE